MDTCGAKTMAGTPCKQKAIYWNGRCKFHGGLATGPTTEAGKEQCRINGRKGGRPRKDGEQETEVLIPQENPKIRLDAQVAARDSSLSEAVDHKVSIRVSALHADITSAEKTKVMETEINRVSEALPGNVSVVVSTTELHNTVRPESMPEKPKSWMLKEANFLPTCERCKMFASKGACLAVAKGRISSMPAGDDCDAFEAF